MIVSNYMRQVFPIFALAVLLASPAAFVAAEDGNAPVPSNLWAGAATSNITPRLGTRVVGSFAPYPAEHIHDELHARCLVLDDGETKLALVVCDLLGLHRSVSVEARRLIEEETGIPPQNVLVSATHTHSAGTALGHNRYANEQELDDYQRFVARRMADGVRRALNLLRPAEIAFTRVDAPEQVHNRRWRAHVSADYFGMFCEALKRRQPRGDADPPFVALLANGTSGDINNIDRLNPRGSRQRWPRPRRDCGLGETGPSRRVGCCGTAEVCGKDHRFPA